MKSSLLCRGRILHVRFLNKNTRIDSTQRLWYAKHRALASPQ